LTDVDDNRLNGKLVEQADATGIGIFVDPAPHDDDVSSQENARRHLVELAVERGVKVSVFTMELGSGSAGAARAAHEPCMKDMTLTDTLTYIVAEVTADDDRPRTGALLQQTVAAWDAYAEHCGFIVADGLTAFDNLIDFDVQLLCIVADRDALAVYWHANHWEFEHYMEGGPAFDSLTVLDIDVGVAAFWSQDA
jgi:hypothetical protein